MGTLSDDEYKVLIGRFDDAKADRANFERQWDQIAQVSRPEISFTSTSTPGNEKRMHLYDDSTSNAQRELAGALDFSLTNTATRWFGYMPADPGVDLERETKLREWLYTASSLALNWLASPDSGFQKAMGEFYLDFGSFGTGTIAKHRLDGDGNRTLRFQCRALASMYLEQDDSGRLVGEHRKTTMRPAEIADAFGTADLGDKLAEMVRNNVRDKVEVVHSCWRRSANDSKLRVPDNFRWGSAYLVPSCAKCVKLSGFNDLPYIVGRWSTPAESTYGFGPGGVSLPNARAINLLARDVLAASELAVRPPITVPANGIEGKLVTKPGAIIMIRRGTTERPEPLLSGARVDVGEAELERRGARIERTYMADRFRLPESDRMTAAEIHARRTQGLIVLSPVAGVLAADVLNEIAVSTFNFLLETRRLPPYEGEIPRGGLAVAYSSPLFASRQSGEADAINQVVGDISPLASISPAILDNFDFDRTTRLLVGYRNANPKVLRQKKEVDAMRKQQSQVQEAATATTLLGQGASAAKDLATAQATRFST